MFRVSMFPEVVLGVILLVGGSQVGIDEVDANANLVAEEGERGAAIDPNGRQGTVKIDLGGLLFAENQERGAMIDPNGGKEC